MRHLDTWTVMPSYGSKLSTTLILVLPFNSSLSHDRMKVSEASCYICDLVYG
jgi:hypothetical protein